MGFAWLLGEIVTLFGGRLANGSLTGVTTAQPRLFRSPMMRDRTPPDHGLSLVILEGRLAMHLKPFFPRIGIVNTSLWLFLLTFPFYLLIKPQDPTLQDPVLWKVIEAPEQEHADIVIPRMRAKNQLAEDVIASRRTLFEAAALFAALNRLPPEVLLDPLPRLEQLPSWFEPDTEEDWLCLMIIDWIDHDLYRDVFIPQREQICARLRQEFIERRKQGPLVPSELSSRTPVDELLDRARKEIPGGHPVKLPPAPSENRSITS